eukprot:jgi/Mesen1/7321/ME000376S06493
MAMDYLGMEAMTRRIMLLLNLWQIIAELHKQLEEKRSKLAEAQGLLQGMSRPEQTNGSNLPPPPPGQPASGKPRLAIPSGELLGRNKPAPGHSEERRAGTERAPVGQREGFASESTRGHDAAPGPSSQQQQQLQQHDRLRQPGGATTSGRGGPGANEGTRDGSRREQAREKQQPRGSACRPDDGNSPEPSRVPAAAKRVPLPATVNIIPLIRSSKDAHGGGGGSMMLRHSEYVGSQHKRKLRSLVLSPSNPNQCATRYAVAAAAAASSPAPACPWSCPLPVHPSPSFSRSAAREVEQKESRAEAAIEGSCMPTRMPACPPAGSGAASPRPMHACVHACTWSQILG